MKLILNLIPESENFKPSLLAPFFNLTTFKLLFVLFLLILTLVLYFNPTQSTTQSTPLASLLFILSSFATIIKIRTVKGSCNAGVVLESGLGDKNLLKNIIFYGSFVATAFSTGLTIKSELVSGKLADAQKELVENRELIRKSIGNLAQVQSNIKEVESRKYAAQILSHKMESQYNALKFSTSKILKDAKVLQDIIDNPNFTVSEKVTRIRYFKETSIFFERDLEEFKKLSDSINYDAIANEVTTTPSNSNSNSNTTINNSGSSETYQEGIKEGAVEELVVVEKKANIIDWVWFEALSSWEKLAVSLLLSNYLIFSSLLGIIFNIYGDYLLKKYNIESRFPRLATAIKLRRTFSRYYLIFDCCMIFGVIVIESALSFYILYISNSFIT